MGSGPFGSVAFWLLSFVSLWLGGVRCGAIRLGSRGAFRAVALRCVSLRLGSYG